MIDGVKITLSIPADKLEALLDFTAYHNKQTGELLTNLKPTAELDGLVFTFHGNKPIINVRGSIHKFANNGCHNADRLTLSRFIEEVRPKLSPYINDTDAVHGIEFGVNLSTPFNPTDFINNLLSIRGQSFNYTRKSSQCYAESRLSQYVVKIYDKGMQYGLPDNILRIELKYFKLKRLFPGGLTWGQLSNLKTWELLADKLLRMIQELIYWDPTIRLDHLSPQDEKILREGHNPLYWQDLPRKDHPDRIRNRYQGLVAKHGSKFTGIRNMVRAELDNLIDQSAQTDLVQCYQSKQSITGSSLPDLKNQLVQCSPLLPCNIAPIPLTVTPYTQMILFPELGETRRRYCPVTREDITYQKPDSQFLCTTGLRWLRLRHPDRFEELRKKRLSRRWEQASPDTQLREIAHSIRNEYYNPINNERHSAQRIDANISTFNPTQKACQQQLRIAGFL